MTRVEALRKALTYLAETPGEWRDNDITEAVSELDDWLCELEEDVIDPPDESDAIDIEHEETEEDDALKLMGQFSKLSHEHKIEVLNALKKLTI